MGTIDRLGTTFWVPQPRARWILIQCTINENLFKIRFFC